MSLKKCPVCGAEFNARGRTVYCSPKCKNEAAVKIRRAWEERTGFQEKQRLYMRNKRAERSAERDAQQKQRLEQLEERNAQILANLRRDFEERCKAGDPSALMEKALSEKNYLEYWRQFARRQIAFNETLSEENRHDYQVNGISVYDPDFAEIVLDSIEESGECIQIVV